MLQGATFLLIQLHPGAVATVLLFLLSGFGASGALTPVSACYAESTPNDIRGRVYSVVNASLRVALAVGYFAAGLIADRFSSVTLLTLGGILLLVATPLITLSLRGFSALKKQ